MEGRDSRAYDDWVEEARRSAIGDVIAKREHRLKRHGRELVGPCPACGGEDRFSVNLAKNLFHCRKSGAGGDAIAMVMYLDGADFAGAVETITGRPPPQGARGRASDPALIDQRRREAEAATAMRERSEIDYRAREIRRAHDIWMSAGPVPGSPAQAYLAHRGLDPPPGAKLRSLTALPYWHHIAGDWRHIHEGPAMAAAIQGSDGRFIGCHLTYIAADLLTCAKTQLGDGKATIIHPQTGELLPAKKVRGSAKGGHIHLGGPADALRLAIGEGIETVLSVAAVEDDRATLYWASVSLGNLGGRAAGRVAHPAALRTDRRGRKRRLMVPDAVPAALERAEAALMPPEHMTGIVILGDGDSDRFTTDLVVRRAAARWSRPGRTIRAAWADDGCDFNSMLRASAHPADALSTEVSQAA